VSLPRREAHPWSEEELRKRHRCCSRERRRCIEKVADIGLVRTSPSCQRDEVVMRRTRTVLPSLVLAALLPSPAPRWPSSAFRTSDSGPASCQRLVVRQCERHSWIFSILFAAPQRLNPSESVSLHSATDHGDCDDPGTMNPAPVRRCSSKRGSALRSSDHPSCLCLSGTPATARTRWPAAAAGFKYSF
jgi:hypothetical protein